MDILEIMDKIDDVISGFLFNHGLHKYSGLKFVNKEGEWVDVCLRGSCMYEKIIPSDHPLMIHWCLKKPDIKDILKLLWRTKSLSFINKQYNII